MASLRTADPALRNYFKKHCIPQVCEALLCGVIINRPMDPLKYLEEMIMVIIENGLESLLWDMCIDPSLKPKIRRLSETYLEQLFGLDDQLVTPELMVKACTFYTGHLVKTHFCIWRDTAIPRVSEEDILAEKMKTAITYYNSSLQKSLFHQWYSYVKKQKEKIDGAVLGVQHILHYSKLKMILKKWKEQARKKYKKREHDLILKHELQLRKWRSQLKLKTTEETSEEEEEEESVSLERSLSEVSLAPDTSQCDISLLPERAVLQIFLYLSLRDVITCGQVNHSWMSMTQMNLLWNAIDFSTVKSVITDRYIVSTLQRWRLNVLHLNFRGCVLRPKTLKSVSHCKNLQELNVSDCPTLTDELMRHISEGCPGILYLNLSNTAITNRTLRLLPRYFHNLQSLSLAYCRKFTDKGLQYLNLGNGCHKLIYLDLSGCTQISVQGFKNIANSCSGIIHMTMNDMPTLTDNCVKALVEKCQCITSVVFIGSPHISDCAFNALSTCSLRKIRFEGNKRITDASFKFIEKNYPNISHIYMADCKGITDGTLTSLSPLKQLTVLNLANCIRIGDMGLKQFLDGPSSIKIRELNLSNCVHLSDVSLVKLSERCSNLNYLSLRNCEHLTDQGVEYIVNLFSLVSLDLSGTVISNEGLIALSRHKKLKELSLSDCCKITNVGIEAFCKSSMILEHLDVSYCPQLSDEIIKALAIYCISLTSLSIAGCPQFTDSAIELLSAKCHYLHILDISGCILLTDQILKDLQRGCKQLQILKMQYCRQISMEEAHRMASVVQQQEYSSDDPPPWFRYDWEGKPLPDNQSPTAPKDDADFTAEESLQGDAKEAVRLSLRQENQNI
ncbi:dynein regulatory complex subunit 6 isoform X2 [Fukomys damarensis]|uniref:F-box and leucine-rich repeat protein 13 n=1 Tax=Fukomys damarensis TaxID=885580 RepID=A0A091EPH0_FUKDA|nr:dynein regulatory complex subunit 6 isoform X2 [Fukomys damarensis]KFO37581.1 F-box/LRR-repeat protein 13 [Fukomys damarensis]